MSRRAPNPAAERAAQNTQTIKSLLKLEGNKTCADCKRNKHPRWASWNLGIFICIRCSGIHRGMGTHISRVKSVDLDAWTDEQLQSVLKWGNSRANKYWESKLAPGHVPSESKIENFIRTKYESKRWVMEGPIPDPSTLEADGDDDVPLSLVKEKQAIERSTSQRASASQAANQAAGPSQVVRAQQPDLFGDDAGIPSRANSGPPASMRPPPKTETAPPKQTKPADSLLGLDFFGTEATPPNRPSSAAAAPGTQSRPDLKQSILSLYASAPRPQPQQQPMHTSQGSFGGMQSPTHSPPPQQSAFGGMNDAFSGLGISSSASPPLQSQPKSSAFSSFGNISSNQHTQSHLSPQQTNLSGGSFFDTKPTNKPAALAPQGSSSGFGAFNPGSGVSPISPTNTTFPSSNNSSNLNDLFDFSAPSPQPPPKQAFPSPAAQHSSVFNLSQAAPSQSKSRSPSVVAMANWSNNSEAWGSNDAWGAGATTLPSVTRPSPRLTSTGDFGWGSRSGSLASQSIVPGGGGGFGAAKPTPKVSADDDFGGWSSAAPATPGTGAGAGTGAAAAVPTKPAGGFTASEDLFSNVWE